MIGGDAVMVAHAADQDLEVLHRATGAAPSRIFDTQIAARFLGPDTPSLAALCERELGRQLPKANRLTDWLERPLRRSQLDYAAADVACLLEIADGQAARLGPAGPGGAWAEDEFDALLRRSREPRRPEEAWTRIKEARRLRGQARSVAPLAGGLAGAAGRRDQPAGPPRAVRHGGGDPSPRPRPAPPRRWPGCGGWTPVWPGAGSGAQDPGGGGGGDRAGLAPAGSAPAGPARPGPETGGGPGGGLDAANGPGSVHRSDHAGHPGRYRGPDGGRRPTPAWTGAGGPIWWASPSAASWPADAALAFEDGAVVFEERSRRPVEPPRPPARPGA